VEKGVAKVGWWWQTDRAMKKDTSALIVDSDLVVVVL
jgi:hypothetical protein